MGSLAILIQLYFSHMHPTCSFVLYVFVNFHALVNVNIYTSFKILYRKRTEKEHVSKEDLLRWLTRHSLVYPTVADFTVNRLRTQY